MADAKDLTARAKALLGRAALHQLKNVVEIYEIVDATVDESSNTRGRINDATARIRTLSRLLAKVAIAEKRI
jgi:hypothetical protein